MTKAAITTIGAALLAAAALALSGCSYPGDDEDRAAFHAEAQDPVPLGTGYRAYRAGDRRREHRGRRPGREVGRNRGPGRRGRACPVSPRDPELLARA